MDFAGTALMPKAHGTAKVELVRGGLQVNVHLQGLGPASQIDPAYLTYVLWAIPTIHGEQAQNLGELVTNRHSPTWSGPLIWPSRGAERMVRSPGVYSTDSWTRRTSPSRGSVRPAPER